LINLEVAQLAEVRASRGQEVQAAVEQLAALERHCLGDPVQGFQRRVNLQLVSGNLLGRESAVVGGFGHEAANVVQEAAHLAEGAVGGGDHLVGTIGIADGPLDAGDVAAKVFAGDQTGRVIFTRVDAKTGAKARQSLLQSGIGPAQRVLSDQRAHIRVNTCHFRPPFGTGICSNLGRLRGSAVTSMLFVINVATYDRRRRVPIAIINTDPSSLSLVSSGTLRVCERRLNQN
jgi:hypothetical protein